MSFREALVARWWSADPFRPTEESLRYYEIKHAIVKDLQPKSICEIGVRAGYSAYAFLDAAPNARFLGIDRGTAGAVDVNEAAACCTNLTRILEEFPGSEMMWKDSQKLKALPMPYGGKHYEFLHVDADHTHNGCAHDLLLGLNSKWILVDDFDVGPEVRAACRDFLIAHKDWHGFYIPDGFRGNLLLEKAHG